MSNIAPVARVPIFSSEAQERLRAEMAARRQSCLAQETVNQPLADLGAAAHRVNAQTNSDGDDDAENTEE